MRPKWLYLALCFIGEILPYWQFVPWVSIHGLNLRLLLQELFANRISAFFGIDAIVTAIVVIIFVRIESRRLRLEPSRRWLPVIAVLTVGASLGLPLFLYLRELHLERTSQAAA